MNRLGVYRTYIPTYYIIASGYTSYSYILYIFRIIYSYLFSIGIELSHIRSQLKKYISIYMRRMLFLSSQLFLTLKSL